MKTLLTIILAVTSGLAAWVLDPSLFNSQLKLPSMNMDIATVIWTIVGVATFVFVLYGLIIESKRNEEAEKKAPYPHKRRSLWWCIKNDLRGRKDPSCCCDKKREHDDPPINDDWYSDPTQSYLPGNLYHDSSPWHYPDDRRDNQ